MLVDQVGACYGDGRNQMLRTAVSLCRLLVLRARTARVSVCNCERIAEQSPIVPSNPADIPNVLMTAPPVAKGLAASTMALWVLGQIFPGLESVLALKANNTYGAHSYLWNVFTAGFYNSSFILALGMALLFLLMGRFLVPVWGPAEFVRFLLFTSLLSGVIVFFTQVRTHVPRDVVCMSIRRCMHALSGTCALWLARRI
jgi:membrane associated rhomboid family serine protease